jgi:F0F1-type ATP synthase membrane subunit c/vacuolar-type H+-ATPase subunit K
VGLTGWQSGLNSGMGGVELADAVLNAKQPNSQFIGYLIATLGLAAVLLLFPELVPLILADAAAGAGEGAAAGAAVDAAAEEPGYITWAKSVVDNPNADEDTLEKAEEILYRNKML